MTCQHQHGNYPQILEVFSMLVQNSQSIQACQEEAKLFEEINFKLKPNRKALDMSLASIMAKDRR